MTDINSLRSILIGNDVGLFPDEMTIEYMALFRMREIAGLYAERGEAQQKYAKLLLENHYLRTEQSVKAEAQKRAALWRMKYQESHDKEQTYRAALTEIALTVAHSDVVRIVGVAFGLTPGKFKAWKRAAKAKIERQKLHPSRRRMADE